MSQTDSEHTLLPPCLAPHVTICCTLSDAVYAGLPGHGPMDASNAAPSVDTLRFGGMHGDTGIQHQHQQGFPDPTTVSLLCESDVSREDSVEIEVLVQYRQYNQITDPQAVILVLVVVMGSMELKTSRSCMPIL